MIVCLVIFQIENMLTKLISPVYFKATIFLNTIFCRAINSLSQRFFFSACCCYCTYKLYLHKNSLTLFPTEHWIFMRNQTIYCWQWHTHKFSGGTYVERQQPVSAEIPITVVLHHGDWQVFPLPDQTSSQPPLWASPLTNFPKSCVAFQHTNP